MNLILPQPVLEVEGDRRFTIYGVSWESYEQILAALGDRHIFLTYDGENLEFMSPSEFHERCKRLIGRFIEILTEELNIPICALGQTTWKRRDMKRALEADDCFYIRHFKVPLGKKKLDLSIDPPPDLAIEIDITRSSLDRQSVYAKLRVPEIWRYNGDSLRVDCLNVDGHYQLVERSPTFPYLDLDQVIALIQEYSALDDTSLARRCRAWIRKKIVPLLKKGKSASGKKNRGVS